MAKKWVLWLEESENASKKKILSHAAAAGNGLLTPLPPLPLPLITLFVALASTLGGLLVAKISPSASVSSPSAPAWCA